MIKSAHKTINTILPTYNEAGNVIRLIKAIKRATQQLGWHINYHVIDDNSPDNTGPLTIKAFAKDKSVKVTIRKNERGLATAVLKGIKLSKTQYVLLMDADFNHHPKYIPQMIQHLKNDPNSVISGSRYISGGGMDAKEHYLGSRFINDITRTFLQTPVTDFTGGFLLIKLSQLKKLPLDWIFRGYGEWGLRLHFLLAKNHIKTREISVQYPARTYGTSKTNIPLYAVTLIKTIFEIHLSAIFNSKLRASVKQSSL